MKFEVDTTQVAGTKTRLQAALDSVSESRAAMFQAIESLNGMWAGQAHDAYLAQFTIDSEMTAGVIGELQSLINSVDTARRSYDTCEQTVKDLVAAVVI